jgi:hypothetical protein
MDTHAFDLWLKEAGLQVVTTPLVPAGAEAVSDDVAELLPSPVEELDLAESEEHDEDAEVVSEFGQPGDRLENTELVAAAFRAAGNPRYEDVKLKAQRSSNCLVPSYREIALQRAKRVNLPVAW